MADFAAMIEKERERLAKMRDEALTRRKTIDDEIAEIDREVKAIAAYETAKTGKKPGTGTRGRRGSRQESILATLKGNGDGLTRSEILDKLGLKGNKAGEQAVS